MHVSKAVTKLFGWSIVSNLVSLLGITIFANELGASRMGSFFLFQSVVILSTLIGDFGISTSIEKQVSNGLNRSKIVSSGLVILSIITLGIITVLVVASSWITSYIGVFALPELIAAIIARQGARLFKASLRGSQRVGDTAVLTAIDKITWFVVGGILLVGGHGVFALIYGDVAGAVCVLIFSVIKLKPKLTIPSLESISHITSVAKWSGISDLGGAAYNWLDIAILGILAGQSAVGIYEIAWRVATATLLFSQAIRRTAFPKIVAEGGQNNTARIEELLTKFVTPSVYFVIPALVGAAIIGEEILSLVFGGEFAAGALILTILMIEKVQRAFSFVLIAPAFALDRPDIDAKSTGIGIMSNLCLNVLLISTLGVVGAAVATLLSETANFGTQYWLLKKHLKIQLPWRELFSTLVGAIFMGLVVVAVTHVIPIVTILQLLLVIMLGGTVYIIVTLMNPVLQRRIRRGASKYAG